MTLPVKHLSARVSWHDNKWNGTYCCNVLDNSFCRILPRIDDSKKPDEEPDGKNITEDNFPPCIAEKGTFLSPYEYTRLLEHAWKDINLLYKEYLPGKYLHKPYSFNAVPFLWMMKGNAKDGHRSEKSEIYGLDFNSDLEDEIDQKLGFEGNTWVQHPENQRVLLDSFFGCLKEQESLIFFYAKHTPLSEPNERVIVGVSKVRKIGSIQHYEFSKGYQGYKSYPWDRCVEHTLTADNPDGFLLPYQELIEKSKTAEIELREFAAIAPDFAQFSYASELVEHDTAIDSLWRIAESLRKAEITLGVPCKKELEWIDNEISRIWDMRGAFPGMGPVLSAIKVAEGNTIAWELEKYIRIKDDDLMKTNPWDLFEESISNPEKIIGVRGKKLFTTTIRRIWQSVPAEKKRFYQLLSRIQLDNDQAKTIIDKHAEIIGSIKDVLNNPYIIYEKMRILYKGIISFSQIDKAVFPPVKIREAFPLDTVSAMADNLDERRVRAFAVMILEEAADEGHSLLPFNDVLDRMSLKETADEFPINEDILLAQAKETFFQEEIKISETASFTFLKLQRLIEIKRIITQRINKDINQKKTYNINYNWADIVAKYFEKNQTDVVKTGNDEFEPYNAPQNLDRVLRCMLTCHNLKGGMARWGRLGRIMMQLSRPG